MLLRLLYLGLMGIHLSSQDMVTLAPNKSVSEPTSPTVSQKPKLKPKIRSLHITSDIKYRYAATLVSTRVVNPDDESGEAVFTITLPESAFISEFLMEIKDEVYKAYVKEKEEAKAVYFEAIQAGQFAGHVAQDARDSNSFTVSVNIEAHGKVTFNLTYEQLLSRNLGVYSHVIIMNPKQIVEDMSVRVDIEEPTEIIHLEVPELQESNNIEEGDVKENKLAKIVLESPNHKIVTWAPTPEEQKRRKNDGISGQFIVKYDVDRSKNPQQILVDEGYFVHFFAPENLPKLKKHVVFVLDYSGSMEGQKLEQLQDAMKKILTDLEPEDFFSIVIFHTYVVAWSPRKNYTTQFEQLSSSDVEFENNSTSNNSLDHEFVVEASSENIDLALSYLKNYTYLGATNIMAGLRTGLQLVEIGQKQLGEDPPQPIVIFLTDGIPNEEVRDTEEIITKIKSLNTRRSPVFGLAFGSDADFSFLRKMSLINYGFARNIYEAADASVQLKNFYRTVASPLFSNVTFSYLPGQVANTSSTKQEFPTYFLGSEIVVAGKFEKEATKDKSIIGELSGVSSDGLRTYPIVIDQYNETHSFGHLEKSWAYLTIQQLLDKADSLNEGKEKMQTKSKALELALKYSFVTRLTSLVVVKPNETTSVVNIKRLNSGSEEDILDLIDNRGSDFTFESFLKSEDSVSRTFNPDFITHPHTPPESIQEEVTEKVSQDEPAPIPHKVTLNEIKWLQPLNSTVTLEGKEYNLSLNETDTSYGNCTVQGEAGECRHIQFCALDVFQDQISQFKPYQCPIAGDFLGVCCPKMSYRHIINDTI